MTNNSSGTNDNDRAMTLKLWFSNKLRSVREEKEVSLPMLSLLADVPEQYLHKVEEAELFPSSGAMAKIARALCISVSDFEPPSDM